MKAGNYLPKYLKCSQFKLAITIVLFLTYRLLKFVAAMFSIAYLLPTIADET